MNLERIGNGLVTVVVDGINYKIPFKEKFTLIKKLEAMAKETEPWDNDIDWEEIARAVGSRDIENTPKGSCPPKDGICPNMFRVIPSGQSVHCQKCGKTITNTMSF